MRHIAITSIAAILGFAVAAGNVRAADPQYKLLKDIAIGGAGSWDYLSADPANHRLYVSHGTKVVIIDTEAGKKLDAEILDTPGVHGFAIAPDLKLGFSTNGQENKSSIVDLSVNPPKTTQKVTTGGNPDAVLYEPKSGEVWTFNGRGNDVTAYEAKSGKVLAASIPVGGKPETGVADATAGRVYLNVEDKNEVVVIDIKEHKVVEHWPIAPGTAATGMSFDPALHRLIIGCGNSKMVMMDSTNGKVVATLDCGQGVDAAAVDPERHMAFVSAGGSGTVTIAKMEADKLTLVQTLTTERGARTMTIDAKTHRIYLSNAKVRNDPTTFHVLEFGLEEPKP